MFYILAMTGAVFGQGFVVAFIQKKQFQVAPDSVVVYAVRMAIRAKESD